MAAFLMDTLKERRELERFRELVLADHELHRRLREATSEKAFAELAERLGAEHGCIFTVSTVEAALRDQRRILQERWV